MNRKQYSFGATVTRHLVAPSTSDAVSVLKNAWGTVRYDLPQLAAFHRDELYMDHVFYTAIIDAWLSSSFFIEPQVAEKPEQLYSQLGSVETVVIYCFLQTSQLISHRRIDGVGTMDLFNCFSDSVNHPRAVHFGDEGRKVADGLDEANAVSTLASPQVDHAATEKMMVFVEDIPSISLAASTPSKLDATNRA